MVINSILIRGSVAKKPEMFLTKKENQVTNFVIKCGRDFFEVEAWNTLAQNIIDKVREGDMISITGRLRNYKWIDDDGKNHSRIKIVADSIGGIHWKMI